MRSEIIIKKANKQVYGPTRISAGVGDHPCFLTFMTMIPIDCRIINFSIYLCKYNILITVECLNIKVSCIAKLNSRAACDYNH